MNVLSYMSSVMLIVSVLYSKTPYCLLGIYTKLLLKFLSIYMNYFQYDGHDFDAVPNSDHWVSLRHNKHNCALIKNGSHTVQQL